ncbi:MAG: hypothetical protein KDC39_11880 [Actinobacteria bacterium]|nr:hypothetical protein [Actinomycetota bacterium]
MATKQQIWEYVHSNLTVHSSDANSITLLFDTDWGRSQFVSVFCADTSPFVTVVSRIGPSDRVDANRLLQLSTADTKVMGIRQFGDSYFVSHVAFLDELTSQGLIVAMQWVLEEADSYEQQLGLGDEN